MALKKIQRVATRRGVAQPPRSRAFFLELLLNMLIFALCSVVALQVFAESKVVTDESAALTTLSLDARTVAESYKASDGGFEDIVINNDGTPVSGEITSSGDLVFYYDTKLELSDAANAYYRLVVTPAEAQVVTAVEVIGYAGDKELFRFSVLNYQPQRGEVANGTER